MTAPAATARSRPRNSHREPKAALTSLTRMVALTPATVADLASPDARSDLASPAPRPLDA